MIAIPVYEVGGVMAELVFLGLVVVGVGLACVLAWVLS